MKKKKISDAKLLQEFESGKTLKQIGKEYDYGKGAKQTLSKRLKNLKNYKYRKKVKLTKSNNGNSRIISIPGELIEKAGFDPESELKARREVEVGKIILDIEKS